MKWLLLCFQLVAVVMNLSNSQESRARIYKGFNAEKGQLPYQVLLLQDTLKNSTEFCGGALISTSYVLTAAHCVYETYRSNIYLGVSDTKDGTGVVMTTVSSENTIMHPKYDPSTFENDIAILKLPLDITLSDQIQTIGLTKIGWAAPDTFDNYEVTASGWGLTTDNENGIYQFLQYRRVYIMPHDECASYYYNTLPITDGMICTDKKIVYSGPCQGDSGGPLTVKLRSGLYLIGLVSWSVGSCSGSAPVVYTNIGHYLPWISSETGLSVPW